MMSRILLTGYYNNNTSNDKRLTFTRAFSYTHYLTNIIRLIRWLKHHLLWHHPSSSSSILHRWNVLIPCWKLSIVSQWSWTPNPHYQTLALIHHNWCSSIIPQLDEQPVSTILHCREIHTWIFCEAQILHLQHHLRVSTVQLPLQHQHHFAQSLTQHQLCRSHWTLTMKLYEADPDPLLIESNILEQDLVSVHIWSQIQLSPHCISNDPTELESSQLLQPLLQLINSHPLLHIHQCWLSLTISSNDILLPMVILPQDVSHIHQDLLNPCLHHHSRYSIWTSSWHIVLHNPLRRTTTNLLIPISHQMTHQIHTSCPIASLWCTNSSWPSSTPTNNCSQHLDDSNGIIYINCYILIRLVLITNLKGVCQLYMIIPFSISRFPHENRFHSGNSNGTFSLIPVRTYT